MLGLATSLLGSSRLPRIRIDSATLGRRVCYMLWRQTHNVMFEPNDDPPEIKANFAASIAMYNAGPMVFGQTTTMPQRYHRSPRKIAKDGIDHYFLLLVKSGRFYGQCDGHDVELAPGGCALFCFASPSETWSERSELVGLTLPRAILGPLLDDPDRIGGSVLSNDAPLCRVLFNHVCSMADNADQLHVSDAAGLAPSTAAMIAVCFGPALSANPQVKSQLRAASLVAIKRHIDSNLYDPALNAAQLTHVFGLSRASIYRMFEPLGGVARFTLHRRLRKALIQLSAPEYAHLQVSEVAHKLGFSTSASFTRAFKTEFGIRPSEVRRDHQVGITALSTATAADEPLFAEWIHELG